MAAFQIPIPRTGDRVLVDLFSQLKSQLGFQNVEISLIGLDGGIPLGSSELTAVIDQNGHSIANATAYLQANGTSSSISFRRNANPTAPLTPDSIDISNSNRCLDVTKLLQFNKLIATTFRPVEIDAAALVSSPAAFADVISSHQRIVGQLEATLGKMAEETARRQNELESQYSSKTSTIESKFAAKTKSLEEAYGEKERLLIEREKALDDRDNMHARREVRQDIKRQLHEYASKFSLTGSTKKMRLPIHSTVTVALVVLWGLIGFLTWKFGQETQPNSAILTSFLVKSAVLTIASLGLLAWYLRWMNRWFEQHANTEFHLKQFELDIDRATWVVESAMEWKSSQHGVIPTELLASISRNLFIHRDREYDEDMHPADYLATALLGNASHAKVKFGDAEIDYSRRDLRKVVKNPE